MVVLMYETVDCMKGLKVEEHKITKDCGYIRWKVLECTDLKVGGESSTEE